MSEHGHDVLENYYDDDLKMRIGETWASIMRCQDGDDYDECGDDNSRSNPNHPYLEILNKYLPDKSIKILEIGAGDGGETRMFIDDGYENITGITIGNKNLERGKELYEVDLLYEDMHFMPFPNESFDAVIGFQTYEHTPAPMILGLEINRVLKLGGKILMEVPSGEKHLTLDPNPHHLNILEPWQGIRMITKCGFKDVTCEEQDMTLGELRYIFFGEKGGEVSHNNHFNDIVNGKFLTKENESNGKDPN